MNPLRLRATAVLLLLAGAACSRSTTPDTSSLPGVWDVTTVLQSYSVEVPCNNGVSSYCVASFPAGDASLAGTFVIDALSNDTTVRGTFMGAFCDASNGSVGCTHVGPPTVSKFTQGSVEIVPDAVPMTFDRIDLFTTQRGAQSTEVENIHLYDVTIVGDSAHGLVNWARTLGRNPPGYHGTFVARRKRLIF